MSTASTTAAPARRAPTSAPAACALRVLGASKRHGARRVLEGLDLAIEPGSVVGLLGRNGAGKTTLIRGLLGLDRFDAGSVEIAGHGCSDALPDAVREQLGYVAQDTDPFGWMTPRQLLLFWSGFYASFDAALVARLLAEWKIPAHVPISRLSGGERQLLAIVRALATRPKLLVLDEPVAALDPVTRRQFLRELIDGALEHGTTVLFSTHIVSDLERVASHVAFLSQGRIRYYDELERVRESLRRVQIPADCALDEHELAAALARRRDAAGAITAVFDAAGGGLERVLERCGGRARSTPIGLEDLFVEFES